MRRLVLLITLPVTLTACGGGDFSAGNTNEVNGTGGATPGGGSGTGGSSQAGSGGSMMSGGAGGTSGTGGVVASGGTMNTGGVVSSGGTGVIGVDGGTSTGGGTGYQCDLATFVSSIDRTCMADADCVLVWHNTDGCNQLAMGINHNAQDAFADAEAACTATLGMCGYDPQFFQTQDGTQIPYAAESSAVAACVDSRCQSEYAGNRFACGDITCADINFCGTQYSSASPDTPTYGCGPLPEGCNDCTCTDAASMPNCDCATQNGQVFVTCTIN